MKKKILILFIAGCLMLMFSACQKSPESPIVAGKNTEKLISTAKENNKNESPPLSLEDAIAAPTEFVYEKSENNLILTADAKIEIPNNSSMPVIKVERGSFDQRQIDILWNTLVGDRKMWELTEQPTKAILEEIIINERKYLSDAQNSGSVDDIAFLEERIAIYEKAYENAPDTIDVMPATRELKEMFYWDTQSAQIDQRYWGTNGSSIKSSLESELTNDWVYFNVENPWPEIKDEMFDYSGPAKFTFETAKMNNDYMWPGSFINEEIGLDETIISKIGMSPKDATEMTQNFLESIDAPMAIKSISLISDNMDLDGTAREPDYYAYSIECKRIIDNQWPVANLKGGENMLPIEWTENNHTVGYSNEWQYEEFTLTFDSEGIIDIAWIAPLAILETEVENSNLLPFSDIQSVFEKMMFVKYGINPAANGDLKIHITDVKLELARVLEQNSEKNGLLIPVWNFYGNMDFVGSNNSNQNYAVIGSINFLTVNAIDGSIIDPAMGY